MSSKIPASSPVDLWKVLRTSTSFALEGNSGVTYRNTGLQASNAPSSATPSKVAKGGKHPVARSAFWYLLSRCSRKKSHASSSLLRLAPIPEISMIMRYNKSQLRSSILRLRK
ncbi:hypothetical protein KC360_g205 [Hortaea werneckii]|nr:hypothetical protein KC344_g209 [Hortaea werneckii]KAI7180544.1 hypothetical protein KC360_g205 [Hortaea werneckii]